MGTFEYPSLFLSPLTFLPPFLSVVRSLVDFTLFPPFCEATNIAVFMIDSSF